MAEWITGTILPQGGGVAWHSSAKASGCGKGQRQRERLHEASGRRVVRGAGRSEPGHPLVHVVSLGVEKPAGFVSSDYPGAEPFRSTRPWLAVLHPMSATGFRIPD
jgi:hypothetical protein